MITSSAEVVVTELEVINTITATQFIGDGASLSGVDAIPAGLVAMWSGAVADIPDNWILCAGNTVSSYGETVNGSSTYSVPDLQGRFIVGYSGSGDYASIGSTGGADSQTLSILNLPAHTHSGTSDSTGSVHTHSGSSSNDGAHNHYEPYGSTDDYNFSANGGFLGDGVND